MLTSKQIEEHSFGSMSPFFKELVATAKAYSGLVEFIKEKKPAEVAGPFSTRNWNEGSNKMLETIQSFISNQEGGE